MVGAGGVATPAGHAPDRFFKYWLIIPAIFLLLLVGLFPLIYSLVVSFQNITMMEVDTSFSGFIHYAQLFKDARLWQALFHTLLITVIALPLELVLGLLMAQLFLERMPGRQIFVSLLVLPTVISPIVAGATWRLMFGANSRLSSASVITRSTKSRLRRPATSASGSKGLLS